MVTALTNKPITTMPDNIGQIAAAGADTFVAGSAIFNAPDYADVIRRMHAAIGG